MDGTWLLVSIFCKKEKGLFYENPLYAVSILLSTHYVPGPALGTEHITM